jgi:hypothetical protein
LTWLAPINDTQQTGLAETRETWLPQLLHKR